jgi:predicted AAA+ superfamily ATPase
VFERHLEQRLLTALGDGAAVFLGGARQCGKSTLVQALATRRGARYVTLDDAGMLSAARADPRGFLAGLRTPIVIDEVQACPELFPAIKMEVDRDRAFGRFLLTGSANALVVPEMSRSLVGRVELLALRTLSQGEIEAVREGFVDWLFSADPPARSYPDCEDIATRVTRGGYPEAVSRRSPERRTAWFDAYVTTILQRDVRDLANVDGLHHLPQLLRLIAARVASLVNLSELARALAIPQTTLKRYVALLEAVYLVHRLPAWSANLGKRFTRSPKLFLFDSGLAANLQGVDASGWRDPATRRGPLLENFVFGELEKQLGWSRVRARLLHFRTHGGEEIDFLLEDPQGRVVGVEVKASATLSASDAAPLRQLARELGDRFVRGVLLYVGSEVIPCDHHVHALPVSAMWSTPARTRG